ncbi:Ran GTPase-binding protein MOG1 [Aspergillus vadensis CBS 113365]|uniref:Mog1p/PsbP-like protein n=1 Tax=Aspergillus vadensis (strain CBS 113365 / IMI 142717 / IBT 24658) TaxID=1448311 RepID=A0A319BDH5_ASPVC|nr:Mog1p/PsbP-like protein [Aspergillus vadensis CBS 113365]PYH70735.1 Mog1p/PsbP-like protein [Aspergillus vadensis CBS 113365]
MTSPPPTYTPQPLYGGAIKGLIPKGWLDASNLRQIPDHQELYLSPTTLSTLIYEINEYVPDSTSQETLSKNSELFASATSTTQNQDDRETLDKAAILYHILDIQDNDTVSKDTIRFRTPITSVGRREGTGAGRVYTGRVELGEEGGKDVVRCSFLVVRLEEQGSDLVVWGNVPVKEFEGRGDGDGDGDGDGLRGEEGVVGGVVEGLVDGLVVVEWDLFG